MMNFKIIIPIMIAVGVISVGTAFADTFTELIVNGPATVNGKLTVNNAAFEFARTDNKQTAMVLKNNDKQSTFSFLDEDDSQVYVLRSTPGPDGRFDFLDFSGADPTTRVDLAILKSSGNIGIGTTAPTEVLDVNGNLRVRGNIVSTGDICIGNCP